MGQGMLGLGGGHALGSVGTGVEGEQSAGEKEKVGDARWEYGIIVTIIHMQMKIYTVGDGIKPALFFMELRVIT